MRPRRSGGTPSAYVRLCPSAATTDVTPVTFRSYRPGVTGPGMCGLAGELRSRGPADVEAVARMTATMVDRGPDGVGVWSQGGAALGHRRLKVIDLSEHAA